MRSSCPSSMRWASPLGAPAPHSPRRSIPSPASPHHLPSVNLDAGSVTVLSVSPGLQSLDYDNSENQLFLEEERRINHMVSLGLGAWTPP